MRILLLVLVLFLALVRPCAGVENRVQPALATPVRPVIELGGPVGSRLHANLENWELRVPDANPALTQMFFDRDRKPDRRLLPWSGEFVGKYLCASILSYRLLRDPRQRELIERVTHTFLSSQDQDGYLGPFDRQNRLTGKNWDVWGHYWAIRALLLYHEEFGSPQALQAAVRAADMLADRFLDKGIHLTNDGSYGQMNYAVIHAFTQLYRVTGTPRYLEMARWIVKEWDLPGAGLYLRMALTGREMFEFPGNRWESLHDFLGLYDLYLLTGEPRFRDAFTHIWYSILKGDRHNTGGFTSGERTTGNPFDRGAIETCCTVAWIDMSVDMLKLTGDSKVADELELSTLNGMLGGQSPSGRWWTYNTPMDGTKEASAHTIHFQCRPGSPELNCCSVNGPRGMSLLSEWAIMQAPGSVVLNYYGPSNFRLRTPRGQPLQIRQETGYPIDEKITLKLDLATAERFALKLRIPAWSPRTEVQVNGTPRSDVKPGSYLALDRTWNAGDSVVLTLDLSPHFWAGERELDGRTSIYRGPLLLAFDPVYNSMDADDMPELDAESIRFSLESTDRAIRPWLLVSVPAGNGQVIRLCDFVTAGAYGNPYRSWLPIRNLHPFPYDRSHPAWTTRPLSAAAPTQ